jgi:RecA-family ATPase
MRSTSPRQIDVVILDPFVKTHSVPESDNNAIDFVAGILAELAIKHDVAAMVLHHVRKGGDRPGDADAGRGASALKDAGRLVYTMNRITEKEADTFNLDFDEASRVFRFDSAK